MKVVQIAFLILLIGGLLWGGYEAIWGMNNSFMDALTANNETFIATTSGSNPTFYILGVCVLALCLIVFALRR